MLKLTPSTALIVAAFLRESTPAATVKCIFKFRTSINGCAACDGAERLWEEVRASPRWLEDQLAQGAPLAGFDAGAYPDGDPRGDKLIALIQPRLSAREGRRLDELLSAVRAKTGQFPSVDLALALLASALHLPAGSASVIFVVGRTAGWAAHIEEQAASGETIRPRARSAR